MVVGTQASLLQSTFGGVVVRFNVVSGSPTREQSGAPPLGVGTPPPGTRVSALPAYVTGGPIGEIEDIQAAGFTTIIAGEPVEILYPFS